VEKYDRRKKMLNERDGCRLGQDTCTSELYAEQDSVPCCGFPECPDHHNGTDPTCIGRRETWYREMVIPQEPSMEGFCPSCHREWDEDEENDFYPFSLLCPECRVPSKWQLRLL